MIAGLTGFAISQPLLAVLGDNPTVFTRQRVVGNSLILFVVLLALLPPLVLWTAGALVSFVSRRAGDIVHLITVGTLVALTAVQLLKRAGVDQSAPIALAALGGGLLFVAVYDRLVPISMWARYTAPLPLLAVALFLLSSPAGALVRTGGQPAAAAPATNASVVIVVLDEFPTRSILERDGSLDTRRFPNLAAFAEDATWYRRYTAMSPFTASAVPSMLTGRAPSEAAPDAAAHPDSLFSLFGAGHRMVVSETATTMCDVAACEDPTVPADADIGPLLDLTVDVWQRRVGLGTDATDPMAEFAEEIPSSASVVEGSRVFQMPTRVERFVKTFDATRPTLYFLHAMVPHQPWVTWPEGTVYAEPDPVASTLPLDDREHRYSWDPWEARVSEQRHLLQAQYADRIVGEVIDALRSAGIYDESLVVFAADHGASFEPDSHVRRASPSTLDAIAYAPLFVKPPGQVDGTVSDANLMSIDVVPTIADDLKIDLPWEVDGTSAHSPDLANRGTTKTFYRFENVFDPQLEEILEFDDESRFPDVPGRLLGPLDNPDDPLGALYTGTGMEALIGRHVESFTARRGGTARVLELDALRRPPTDDVPLGVVQGEILAGPEQGTAVLAVDGVVVAASPLMRDSAGVLRYTMLLPDGALGPENDIRLVVVDQGVAAELALDG